MAQAPLAISERAAAVFADDAAGGGEIGLVQRIGAAAGHIEAFFGAGEHLAQQRIVRVAAGDQRQIVRRHLQREIGGEIERIGQRFRG